VIDRILTGLATLPNPGYIMFVLGIVSMVTLFWTIARPQAELAFAYAGMYFLSAVMLTSLAIQMFSFEHIFTADEVHRHYTGWGMLTSVIVISVIFGFIALFAAIDDMPYMRALFMLNSLAMFACLCWEFLMRYHSNGWAYAYGMFEIVAFLAFAVFVIRGTVNRAKRRTAKRQLSTVTSLDSRRDVV
jgi:hypothetical protein